MSLPRVVPNQVRGTYLEVADHRTPLLQKVLRRGLKRTNSELLMWHGLNLLMMLKWL